MRHSKHGGIVEETFLCRSMSMNEVYTTVFGIWKYLSVYFDSYSVFFFLNFRTFQTMKIVSRMKRQLIFI